MKIYSNVNKKNVNNSYASISMTPSINMFSQKLLKNAPLGSNYQIKENPQTFSNIPINSLTQCHTQADTILFSPGTQSLTEAKVLSNMSLESIQNTFKARKNLLIRKLNEGKNQIKDK